MTTTDPLSLAQTKRLAADADTILLRATRPADLETPIGAFPLRSLGRRRQISVPFDCTAYCSLNVS